MVNKDVNIKILFDGKQFTDGIGKAQKSLKAFKDVGKRMAIAGAAMGVALGGVVKIAGDFEKSMSRVRALSGANTTEFNSLSQAARDLGKSTVFSASEAAEGMSYLAMAGYNTSEIIAAMPGLLDGAAAGQLELGRTADITSNILSGFGIEANKTNEVMDVLTATFTSSNTTMEELGDTMKFVAPVAKAAGISLEQTAAAAGIMANAGIKGGMAGRQLRSMIVRLIAPPKDAADAINELGLSITDEAGKMRPLADIITQTKVAMEGMSDSQKTAMAASIAGREAVSGFLSLLGAGGPAIANYTKELENSAGVAKKIAAVQTDNLGGSFVKLKSALMEAAIAIGTALIPAIRSLVDLVKGWVDWFNKLSEPTKAIIAKIAALTAVLLLVVGPLLFIIGSIPVILAGIGAVTAVIGAIIAVASGIGPLIWLIIAAGIALVANWDKIKAAAIAVWEKGIAQSIADLLKKFPEWINQIKGKAIEIGKALVQGIITGIKNMASWLKNNLKDWAGGVITEIKRQFQIKSPSKITEKIGKNLVEGLNVGISNTAVNYSFLTDLVNITNEATNQLSDTITSNLSGSIAGVLDGSKSVGEGIKGFFRGVQQSIIKMVADMIAEMMKLYVIKPMLQSIFSGLSGFGGGTGGGLMQGIGGIAKAFGGFFAEGGSPPLGKASIVGERGPELFVPKQSGTIIPNGATGGQSNPTYVYAPNIQTSASKEEVFGILDKHSREFFNRIQIGFQNNHGLRSTLKST